ncbi:hypothetical protein [Nocardioides yefusunii]|uniref:PASTA domain-containing protein n=1 Tax=Nocardioides yefusunii TaxID=2500546 RepID=A0ABW1QZH3_9ACTN|nr:hypothetical protein [Nocardioides yefusunii]
MIGRLARGSVVAGLLLGAMACSNAADGDPASEQARAAEQYERCQERAESEYGQLAEIAEPLAEVRTGEVGRDLECADGDPLTAVSVRASPEISPEDALAMLGPEWVVEKDRGTAKSREGRWKASAHRAVHEDVEVTLVTIFD